VFLIFLSVIMMNLFSNVVFAQDGGLGEGLGGVAETISDLFGFIPDVLSLDKLTGASPDTLALFWAKFLIWLLLFAALYYGANKVFVDSKRVAVIVALAISFMGALLIPEKIVVDIFQTYGLAAGFIVWFIPVVAGLFIAHKIGNPVVKTVFYLVLILLLINIDKSLTAPGSWLEGNNWIDYFRLLFAVVIIAFIWNLFSMFGGGGGVSGAVSDRVGRIGDSIGDWISGDDSGRGRRRRRRDRDDGDDIDDDEEEADVAEINVERRTYATLNEMKSHLDKIEVDTTAAERAEYVKKAKDLIPDLEKELKAIYDLERKEISLEQLSDRQKRKLGISGNNAVAKLIRNAEIPYTKHLESLVTGIGTDLIGRPNIRNAKSKINGSINTVKLLVRINSRELGALREREDELEGPRR